MKKNHLLQLSLLLLLFTGLQPAVVLGQSSKDTKIIGDCKTAKAGFIKADKLLANLFNNASGYVIFPNVGKGAIGVGGAAGKGILFEKGKTAGKANMTQVSVGFQFGGQAYREVIFFENQDAVNRFKDGKLEFAGQASAVAAKEGAAANVKYRDGVMVFAQTKAGLMYEASIGGQKFGYNAF